MGNLLIAFPEKTEAERKRIARQFYRNFCDSFVEMIKLLSVSEESFRKRYSHNIEVMNDLAEDVPNVTLVSGHFFSWEFVNYTIVLDGKLPLIGVYMHISNKVFDKLVYHLRGRFGSILIPASDFNKQFVKYAKTKYAIGLVADQKPVNPNNAYWTPFFGKLTPFLKGPERTSRLNNSAVIFVDFQKPKRGFYHFQYTLITKEARKTENGYITRQMVRMMEEAIKKEPSNYLWTHKRFKYEFNEEQHARLVI